jgi:hypothetical protein
VNLNKGYNVKISYVDFKKEFPVLKGDGQIFNKFFYIKKYWNGKIIVIGFKSHQITFDFRGNFFNEMTGKK